MARKKYKEEGSKRPQPVARDGAYVMMLFITLVAIVVGCVLMYLDHDEYAGKQVPKEAPPAVQKLGSDFKGDAAAPAGGAAPAPAPTP